MPFIDDDIAIQPELQRGTHARIGERRFLVIDFVVIGAQIGIDMDFFRDLFLKFLE